MVSMNPADNVGGVKETGVKNFQQQMEKSKEFINSIYDLGGDGNDVNKIDTQFEAFSLSNYINDLKTFLASMKDKLTQSQAKELEELIQEQEIVLKTYADENKLTTSATSPKEDEWHTPKNTHTAGTVMRTVKNEDGSYYEEYKNPNTGRTYISYDANGNRTGASWNTVINGIEYPTRKEWTDADGNFQHINIEYDEQGNIVREYKDE